MRPTLLISATALLAAGFLIAQEPAGAPADQPKAKGQFKGKRAPGQSPASTPPPPTATPQTYPADQVAAGQFRFTAECGFCHGRDAAGGESGPDLTRSELVAADVRGDKIGPVVREGRPSQGMPNFSLSDEDLGAIVAFIHDQKTKLESLAGGRRSVDPEDLATGDAAAGERYFSGVGGCSGCHSAEGDLAGIATRFEGLTLLQRMLYPTGRPAPKRPRITFTLESGETIVAPLAEQDEFTVTMVDPAGERRTYDRDKVEFAIDDPMSAHFEQLGKYTDRDMHDVYAYLVTLK
jgi:cytochrome c oxidase cbb3-type subunit 3